MKTYKKNNNKMHYIRLNNMVDDNICELTQLIIKFIHITFLN